LQQSRVHVPVLLMGVFFISAHCSAENSWGGSIGLTSDYLVRGVSRSDDHAAAQADLHFVRSSGILGGLFASSVEIGPGETRNAEISAFLGFAWDTGKDWHNKIVASHYSYPWNHAGSHYDYDEMAADAAYQDWLDLSVVYSPNAPRYVPQYGLIGVNSVSAEINLQTPSRHRLAATGGLGYSHLGGPDARGYPYWSVGGAYEIARASISLSYVGTTEAARELYYAAAAQGHWTATVIWRF
jgi:uncharacterized protein (TIGR02001 family)